jgi:hypothetical protein
LETGGADAPSDDRNMGKAVTGLESNPVTAHEINNNNGITVKDHFADVSKMIKIGKGGNFVQIGIDAEDYYRIKDSEKETDE